MMAFLFSHNATRYPGWDIETEEIDTSTLRKYLVGGHVAEYMEELMDSDEEHLRTLFTPYIEDI